MSEHWKSPLNFPIFFWAALKNNTATSQQNAVNILLSGVPLTLSNSSQNTISASIVSGYVNGSKRISEDVCLSFFQLTQEERIKRMADVAVSRSDFAVNALVYLLKYDYLLIDTRTKESLLQLPYKKEPILFLSETLLVAIKQNNTNLTRPDNFVKNELFSFRTMAVNPKSSTLDNVATNTPTCSEEITTSTPEPSLSPKKAKSAQKKCFILPQRKDALNKLGSGKRGKCIDDDEKEYYVLDEYDDNDYLEAAPSEFIANILFFITFSCPKREPDKTNVCTTRKNYLLLKHDRYMEEEDLWSVPFCSYTVQSANGIQRPRTIGMIKEYYKKNMPHLSDEINANARQLLFQLNLLSGCSLEEGDSYIEYKKSPSQPDRRKCYYVQEYFVVGLDQDDIINLTDPKDLHGYRYFPLSDWEMGEENIPGIKKDGNKIKFAGGYIPENVCRYIFKQRQLKKRAINLDGNDLFCACSGYLFSIDFIDFAYCYVCTLSRELIHEQDRNAAETGAMFAASRYDLKDIVRDIFQQCLAAAGVEKYTIHDGTLVALLPCTKSSDNFLSVVTLIETIHSKLCDYFHPFDLPTRIRSAINYADCCYFGKQYGLSERKTVFSGEHYNRFAAIRYLVEVLSKKDIHIVTDNTSTGGKNDDYKIDKHRELLRALRIDSLPGNSRLHQLPDRPCYPGILLGYGITTCGAHTPLGYYILDEFHATEETIWIVEKPDPSEPQWIT